MSNHPFRLVIDVEIAQAIPADAGVLSDLGAEIFYRTFAAQNTIENMRQYLAETFTKEKLREEFNEPDALFYIARVSGQPVGYAKLGRKRTPEKLQNESCIELERLYILPEYQNQKIGYRLMAHCIATAKSRGCTVLWLGVWEHHPKAIRFYERIGFRKFGEHVFQLGSEAQTDWLMRLDL